MCNILENYLDDILEKDKTINYHIFNEYEKFNYDNKDLFEINLKFLLDNIYTDIKIVEPKLKRLNQQEFRDELINKYQKCLITNNDCLNELEACHIVELKDLNNINDINNIDINNINNGLLLCSNLHKTFDKYLWSINPDTFIIEISSLYDCGTISNYKNISLVDKLSKYNYYESLSNHYKKFKENC